MTEQIRIIKGTEHTEEFEQKDRPDTEKAPLIELPRQRFKPDHKGFSSCIQCEKDAVARQRDADHDYYIALFSDCESCADGFISTHEKATNAVRKQERERIRLELEKAFRLNKWVERDEAVSILLQALKKGEE